VQENFGRAQPSRRPFACAIVTSLLLAACATPAPVPVAVQPPPAVQAAAPPPPVVKTYKRKIAIGRFTNETRYGRALLTADQMDPLGKQTSDMLSARLVESGRFLVFERPDLNLARAEQALSGTTGNIIGVDALIVGSLTEFGREIEGQSGFFSNVKTQVARAKVEIRLVDVQTAHVFFSASGAGQATSEAGTTLGFGNQAGYDSTLNDRAIGAAVSDVLNSVISKLEERPWRSDILKVDGNQIFVTGGQRQGLKVGDHLAIMQSSGSVRSAQSGFDIALPPTKIAEAVVESSFGDNETNEASICRLVSGAIPPAGRDKLYVAAVEPPR
jgi:curli biogenesis system outer membrane secretion channel CsgG